MKWQFQFNSIHEFKHFLKAASHIRFCLRFSHATDVSRQRSVLILKGCDIREEFLKECTDG